MKKYMYLSMILLTVAFFSTDCKQKTDAKIEKKEASITKPITHKEAMDSLRVDTNAILKALKIRTYSSSEATAFFDSYNLDSLLKCDYPIYGFYGEDRYKIDFFFSECMRLPLQKNVYYVKGKNRHKKEVTPFEGCLKFTSISEIKDPNLDKTDMEGMNVAKIMSAKGDFELSEDKNSKYSGVFKGKITVEFYTMADGNSYSLWYYSQTDIKGGGFLYDGTWTSYKDPKMVKPVLVAADIFQLGNSIMKDFSFGEREPTISPAYRKNGWTEIWDEEEWWNKPEKQLVKK
jgi:hypothetical protein